MTYYLGIYEKSNNYDVTEAETHVKKWIPFKNVQELYMEISWLIDYDEVEKLETLLAAYGDDYYFSFYGSAYAIRMEAEEED